MRGLLAGLLGVVLMCCGCGHSGTVFCDAAPLYRDAGGEVVAGKVIGPVRAPVSTGILVQHENKKVRVQLIGIGAEAARFKVIYADDSSESIDVPYRQSRDVFPAGQPVGARIKAYGQRP
jgi:hypothetical protein